MKSLFASCRNPMPGLELVPCGMREEGHRAGQRVGGEHGSPVPSRRRARPGRQQFQGGSSGAVSAGDGGRTHRRAGAERDGVVNPDVSRQVPVPSLATGRIVEIDARLGDEVKKGQLLFKVRSTDIAGAFSDYRQADQEPEAGGRQRTADEDTTRPRQAPVRKRGIPKSRWKSRKTRRWAPKPRWTTRKSMSRRPRNNSAAGVRSRPSDGYRRSVSLRSREPSRTSKSPINRGVQALTPRQSVHDFRPVARVDHLRRVGKQHGAGAHRRIRGHSSGRLSGPGVEGADQQHPAHHRSHHPHGQGPAGSGESRPDADRNVRHRDLPRRNDGAARHRAGHRRFCICTIASGFTRRSGRRPFPAAGSGRRGHAARRIAGGRQRAQAGRPGGHTNALVFQNTVEQ